MARRLRDNLLLRLVPPMATILLVSGVLSYQLAVRFANRSYDRSLIEDARALSRLVKADGSGRLALPQGALEMLSPGEGDHSFLQIRSREHGVVIGDPDVPVPPDSEIIEPQLYDGRMRGEAVRLVALPIHAWSAGDAGIVLLGETRHRREALASDIVAAVIAPQLALIFFAGIVIAGGVASGLAPLVALAHAITQRRRDDLAPLPSSAVPAEAVPLIDAFNGLLARLAEVLVAQQRFVADAAHQLRTPLAVLKIQLEQALREPDDALRRQLFEQLKVSVGRTARLSGQLLLLARAEPGGWRTAQERIDLRALALEVGAQWVPRALQLGRDLGFDGDRGAVEVFGDRVLLGEVIANLLDNALNYGGPRVTLRVAAGAAASGPELIVEDDGPGIPEAERSRVFERFHRLPGTSGEGSGLGLAIVQEIAQGHGAVVSIETPDAGGLRVRVCFPILGQHTAGETG